MTDQRVSLTKTSTCAVAIAHFEPIESLGQKKAAGGRLLVNLSRPF